MNCQALAFAIDLIGKEPAPGEDGGLEINFVDGSRLLIEIIEPPLKSARLH